MVCSEMFGQTVQSISAFSMMQNMIKLSNERYSTMSKHTRLKALLVMTFERGTAEKHLS